MIGRELRRMRLLLAVCAVAALMSLVGIVVFVVGRDTAALLILLLAVQVLIAGSAVVLHRAVLRTRSRPVEGGGAESRPAISPEDVIEGVRDQLDAHGRNEQRLARLLEQQEAAQSQLRRRLFEEAFTDDAPRSADRG